MATFEELANEWSDYLRFNRENPCAPDEIIFRINHLVFTRDDRGLSIEDKTQLLAMISDRLVVSPELTRTMMRPLKMIRRGTLGD